MKTIFLSLIRYDVIVKIFIIFADLIAIMNIDLYNNYSMQLYILNNLETPNHSNDVDSKVDCDTLNEEVNVLKVIVASKIKVYFN